MKYAFYLVAIVCFGFITQLYAQNKVNVEHQIHSQTNQIKRAITEFNDAAWRKDSTGCLGTRAKMADTLYCNRDLLIGLPATEIISLLGTPNWTDTNRKGLIVLDYFIVAGMQCWPGASPNDIDVASLCIYLEDRNVSRVKIVGRRSPICISEESR